MLLTFLILSVAYGIVAGIIIMQIITKTANWFTLVQMDIIVIDTVILYHQFVNISAMIH